MELSKRDLISIILKQKHYYAEVIDKLVEFHDASKRDFISIAEHLKESYGLIQPPDRPIVKFLTVEDAMEAIMNVLRLSDGPVVIQTIRKQIDGLITETVWSRATGLLINSKKVRRTGVSPVTYYEYIED